MLHTRGVKKVSEGIAAEARSIIITDKNDPSVVWDRIPPGTVYINRKDGSAWYKREGGTEWEPLVIGKLSDELDELFRKVVSFESRLHQLEMHDAATLLYLKYLETRISGWIKNVAETLETRTDEKLQLLNKALTGQVEALREETEENLESFKEEMYEELERLEIEIADIAAQQSASV